jgi:hypothetical protein
MRFQQNDAPAGESKWTRRAPLKSATGATGATGGDVVHHNTLNATGPSHDEQARSREVERFFDLMTLTTSTGQVAR